MVFIVIMVVAVAVGAFIRQQSGVSKPPEEIIPTELPDTPSEENTTDDTGGFILSAKPVTEPGLASEATYTSHAPAGEDSPYGLSSEPKKQAQAAANLLRWCGRSGVIQLENITVPNPIAYWSNGESSTHEPSSIDVTLPVQFPKHDDPLPVEGADSYANMSELQRGIYLTWLAGGRIQPPLHMCYPAMWLFGIERRTIIDKLDLPMCISEMFRLLPLTRWEALREQLINFITWLSIKVWLPDEDLLNFCKRLFTVPEALLDILLSSYANSLLPLPSAVAFTVARTAEKLRRPDSPMLPHSDDYLKIFTPIYKDICNGGIVMVKPERVLNISYTPSNPSIQLSSKDSNPVTVPDFFGHLGLFDKLVDSWETFLKAKKHEQPPAPSLSDIAGRPDFEEFILSLKPEGSGLPIVTTLEELGKLMKFDTSQEAKVTGKIRKAFVDTAQVEGWQIIPDLGTSGREYKWEDKIVLFGLVPGTLLSQQYKLASFVLEFTCSSIAVDEDRVFEPLRQRMNDFFKLTDDDNIRLEAQKPLNCPTQHGPDYYGEFLCAWLSDEERRGFKSLVMRVVSFMPEFKNNPEVNSILCEFLKLNEETNEPERRRKPKDFDSETMKALTMLFKSS